MSERRPVEQRRDEVVQATLDLLAELPLERVTTRAIAERVGVTQPALFRHFASREALIGAVLQHAQDELRQVGARALACPGPPLARVEGVVLGVLEYVGHTPGIPRLLFQDTAGLEGDFREPLLALASAQRALLGGLVRGAVRQGQVPPVDPEGAARLLLAGIQGVVLQWQLEGRRGDLREEGERLLRFWLAGLSQGEPAPRALPCAPQPPARLLHLDLRPLLARGEEPFGEVMQAVDRLAPDGVLALLAPFRPVPLLGVLRSRGLTVEDELLEGGIWRVQARGPQAPELLDLRGLEPPEPMVAVLERAATLAPGGLLLARMPRVPRLLWPRLEERGLRGSCEEQPDGTALLCVERG